MRWWKDLFGIEDQVVLLAVDTANFFSIDEIGNLQAK